MELNCAYQDEFGRAGPPGALFRGESFKCSLWLRSAIDNMPLFFTYQVSEIIVELLNSDGSKITKRWSDQSLALTNYWGGLYFELTPAETALLSVGSISAAVTIQRGQSSKSTATIAKFLKVSEPAGL